ncbi:MAG: hydroxylamine reductase [Planctomycetota bacterium]|jgi:hydroxylamine reductase
MFCYQCEQTAKGSGCTVKGVCGKTPEAAGMMDLLIYATKGIAMYAHRARQLGATDGGINTFTIEALFTTITNVNFDPEKLMEWVVRAAGMRDKAKNLYETACGKAGKQPEKLTGPAEWAPASDMAGMLKQAEKVAVEARIKSLGEDITGLQEMVTFGLKGLSAYADHARILGKEDDEVYGFVHNALDYLANDKPTVDALVGLALETGKCNLRAMELLDAANTGAYGHPEPTQVRVTPIKGKAILVSGHDLKDLDEILRQTEGKGINVYTHGEMLPALACPGLKKHKHLAGNYGNAWQNQKKEFAKFPGAILMTTNCIQQPQEVYKGRIFTTGLVQWPGVPHIENRDFAPVIEAALEAEGFAADEPEHTITVGFGRNAVMSVASKVIEAVKSGRIKHFFLVGGCDGAKSGRNYYTDFTQSAPKDTVILTLACGKYRFNKLDFGDIDGIPRLLDIGQCNDAYSAIQIAVALAGAFDTDVNSLPLSLVLSWYEQKAVAILLTLLHLGIRNMRLGPSLPAFVTEPVLKVLVEKFNISPITTAEEDLKTILA